MLSHLLARKGWGEREGVAFSHELRKQNDTDVIKGEETSPKAVRYIKVDLLEWLKAPDARRGRS